LNRGKPEPEKTELFKRNRPENSRLNRGKSGKTRAFQREPPGIFPVKPEKRRIFRLAPIPGRQHAEFFSRQKFGDCLQSLLHNFSAKLSLEFFVVVYLFDKDLN